MQALRTTVRRLPQQLNRVSKPTITRTFTTTPATMSLFPRFTQEFAPIFRLFDEYDRQAFRDVDHQIQSIRSFTPKFDVKETKDAYELHGELPGIEQKNINIEWTDNNTLTVSGKHEHVREEGQRPTAIEGGEEQKKIESHQPRVEDESAESTESSNKGTQVAKQSDQQDFAKREEPKHKYWVSERSVGSFHRSFAFPARVDQDAVKASLKDGILSIVVPKSTAPATRKVNIE